MRKINKALKRQGYESLDAFFEKNSKLSFRDMAMILNVNPYTVSGYYREYLKKMGRTI